MQYDYVQSIRESGLSIYDPIEFGDPNLWIPSDELERILDRSLNGVSLAGMPLRTRSKVAKKHVCEALGYPVPPSFRKSQPRFPGQQFDTYVQKSNNLQVWNEELSPERRYVLIRIDTNDVITRVKVVTGADLARLDTTGTLTQKYQARLLLDEAVFELVTETDTERMLKAVTSGAAPNSDVSPIDHPSLGMIMPISEIFERLRKLVGRRFIDAGHDQERNRGAALHDLVCRELGYSDFRDNGRYPDVRNQLIEVKLQTSPTIDLGLVYPNSTKALDLPQIGGQPLRHCDVRYAIFYGQTDGSVVSLTHFFLTTGERFFERFPQFQGKVLNKKLQIHLPSDFFW